MRSRGLIPWLLWASVILVACNAVSATPSASPSESPSTMPPEVPTHAPASPSAGEIDPGDPTPSETASSSEPSPSAIAVDSVAGALVDGLRVRATPGLEGTSLVTLGQKYESLVVDGPEVRNGLEWYLISGLGLPYGSGCATGPDPTNPYDCPVWLG